MAGRIVAGNHTADEVRGVLDGVGEVAVATSGGDHIRTRMMHFAADDDFTVYVATMKNDPKTLQITHNPSISLLVLKRTEEMGDLTEVEITGSASLVHDDAERRRARELTAGPSPIVRQLWESGQDQVLDYIRIVPRLIKMRIFREIVQGVPPTVVEFSSSSQAVSDWDLLGRKLRHWLVALRLPFLTASLVPVLLGGAIAWARRDELSWPLLLVTLLAAALVHAGVNVFNDYFDHRSGNDAANREFVRPFSGGSRAIQLGLLSPVETLTGGIVLCALSAGIGIYLASAVGPLVLAFGAVGLLSGVYYTGGLNWARRGLGELVVGLNFGILMTLGSYYVQTERLDWGPLVASIPIALLIAAVLYVNEFPDYAADRQVSKNTWVVRVGRPRAALIYVALLVGVYLSIGLAAATGALPAFVLLAFVTLPLSVRASYYVLRFHSSPLDLAPANALTIVIHLAVGLILALSYVWDGSGSENAAYAVALGLVALVAVVSVYRSIEREKAAFLSAREAVR